MRKQQRTGNKNFGVRRRHAGDLVGAVCLIIVLIMTRMCAAAAAPDEDVTEKIPVTILLRPEKEEGEADPDLTEEIRVQIAAQIGGEDPVLLDRLCGCVSWTYAYDDALLPPGEKRGPGESDIYLSFAEDPEYVFTGWPLLQTEEVPEEGAETWRPEETSEVCDMDADGSEETYDTYDVDTEGPEEVYDTYEVAEEYPEEANNTYAVETECQEEAQETYNVEMEEFEEVYDIYDVDLVNQEGPEAFEAEGPFPEENLDMAADVQEELRSFLTTHLKEKSPENCESSGEKNEPGQECTEETVSDGTETEPFSEVMPEPETEEFFEITVPEENSGNNSGEIPAAGEMIQGEETPEKEQAEETQEEEQKETSLPQRDGSAGGTAGGRNVCNVPSSVAEGVAGLMRGQEMKSAADTQSGTWEAGAEAEESGPKTQVKLLRLDSGNRETDLTVAYQEALAEKEPEKIDWTTVLAPLPENDGTYILRTTETDEAGKDSVRETVFSVNRFGSVYTYNDALQALRGKTVREVKRPLIISEYNPDSLEKNSWQISLSLDGRPVEPVLYTAVCAGDKEETAAVPEESDGETSGEKQNEENRKWTRYDYVIAAENFREDGVYTLHVSSRDTAGNASETNRYNGGGICFTVDGTPPELQTVRGLEKAVVTGRKTDVTVTAFDTVGLSRLSAFVDGKCMAAVTDFADRHRAEMTFSIPKGQAQKVRIVARDEAGNVFDSDEKAEGEEYAFRPAFPFVREITVNPPEAAEAQEHGGTGRVILFLLLLGCGGVSTGMLRSLFRQGKRRVRRKETDPEPEPD